MAFKYSCSHYLLKFMTRNEHFDNIGQQSCENFLSLGLGIMYWLCRDSELRKDDWDFLRFMWAATGIFTISKPIRSRGEEADSLDPDMRLEERECHHGQFLRNEHEWDTWLAEVFRHSAS